MASREWPGTFDLMVSGKTRDVLAITIMDLQSQWAGVDYSDPIKNPRTGWWRIKCTVSGRIRIPEAPSAFTAITAKAA